MLDGNGAGVLSGAGAGAEPGEDDNPRRCVDLRYAAVVVGEQQQNSSKSSSSGGSSSRRRSAAGLRASPSAATQGAQARAQCLEWCFFVLSELDAGSLYVIRRHQYLPQIYGEAPEACAAAARYFADQMPSVERQLDKGHPFLLGDRLSAADIMLTSCLTWAVRFGVGVPEIAVAYATGVTARPAYAQAVARNTPPAASGQA